MSPFLTLAATGLLSGALAAGTSGTRPGLMVAVLAVQVVLIFGWLAATRVPAALGVGAVAVLAALGCDLAVLIGDRTSLGPVVGILGCTVLAAMAVQLARRGGREDLVPSLGVTLAAATFAVALASYLPTRSLPNGRDLVLTGLASVVAAAVPFLLPGPVWLRALLGFVAGTGAAVGVGMGVGDTLSATDGVSLGLAAAGLTAAIRAGLARVPQGMHWSGTALEGALPIAAAAPAVYVIGRVLVS